MELCWRVLEHDLDYTGAELRSHFVREVGGLEGDAALAFVGRCDVPTDSMVDLEDRSAGAFLFSPRMLHVIIEHFGTPLRETVLRQRLLSRLAAELLEKAGVRAVSVAGDDVFVEERKASVSIATASLVSSLVHFGINVRTVGAPVAAWGLEEASLEAADYARSLLGAYAAEIADVCRAATKVRGVP